MAENTIFGKEEPKIGEVVTYTYKTYSTKRGEPTFPRIFRTRPDLAWDDVVRNFYYKSAPRKDVNGTHLNFINLFIIYLLFSYYYFSIIFFYFFIISI